MLRFRASQNASAAYFYFSKSDSGIAAQELRSEVGGRGAELLGLDTTPDFDQFKNVLHGLDPETGEQLTAKLVENRIAYWDITASVPKGVTIAIESGDSRVHDALWQAAKEAMGDIEREVVTRQRKGGAQDDRSTGNMIWYAFEHPETRPNREDGMPDPDRHIHFVVPNLTFDPVEQEWKAIKFRPIMDLRKYFDRRFDSRLASKLTDLGYEVETKYKSNDKGGKSYFSWDVKGIPQSVVAKFSRRADEVEKLATSLGIENAVSKDKLGATSRLHKREDMTLDDYRKYWAGRMTTQEKKKIAETINAASLEKNPQPENTVDKAVAYSLSHHFERRSVTEWVDLAITSMEKSMGGAHPDQILPEALRQGLLLKDGQATTKAVLAEEQRVIAFAREGKGAVRPLVSEKGRPIFQERPSDISKLNGVSGLVLHKYLTGSELRADNTPVQIDAATLSLEQQAIVTHVLTSPDQVTLVVGDAGTGKTHAVKSAFERIDCPVEMLAPSAAASRGVLRDEGFAQADTVASFLMSEKRQDAIKGGVIWVDEAGLLAIRDLSQLVEIAREKDARIVLQGDPKQHKSVVRHGNMLNVLQEFAGLPVGRLTEIWRQKHKGYKALVADIARGEQTDAFDQLQGLGWVQKVEGNDPLVDDYFAAEKSGKSTLIVSPTHVEGDEITADIRGRLTEEGKLKNERVVEQLVPLHWSEAERGDLHRYSGTEILQFHRNSGTFKAGDKVSVSDWKPGDKFKSPAHFSVYEKAQIPLAAGDLVRFTSNGKTADKKHSINNGSVYRIDGFDKHGNMVLDNGWTVAKDFRHLTHGYVTTSVSSQGKSVDRVLIAMGGESRGAINAEQFYVSVSRGKESARIYTDLPAEELKQIIQRTDPRKSATEVFGQPVRKEKPKRFEKLRRFLKKARQRLNDLQRSDTRDKQRGRQHEYDGFERGA